MDKVQQYMVARFDAVRLFIFVLLWTLQPLFTLWLSARTFQFGLPAENFNKKPNSAEKRPGKAKPIISRPEKDQILFVALQFLCHIGTPKLQEYHYKYYSKFGLSLAGLVLELITDVSLTFHGLRDCTLWVQWCHSLHTDPLTAFCTHTKVISHSLLYLQLQQGFFKENVRYPISICRDPISLILGNRFSLILGIRCQFSLILGTRIEILETRIGSQKHLKNPELQ